MSSFFSWCSTQAKNDILHYVRNGLLKKLPLCEETTFIKYIMNEVTTPFIAPCGLWKKRFMVYLFFGCIVQYIYCIIL